MVEYKRIATGKAREEGRAPSHDGEYITVYRDGGDFDSQVIAEHNAGTFDLDAEPEEDGPEDWDAIRAEAYSEDGWQLMSSAGFEARNQMIELGWTRAENWDGNHYIPMMWLERL